MTKQTPVKFTYRTYDGAADFVVTFQGFSSTIAAQEFGQYYVGTVCAQTGREYFLTQVFADSMNFLVCLPSDPAAYFYDHMGVQPC